MTQIINFMWENLDVSLYLWKYSTLTFYLIMQSENIIWRGARTLREQFINNDEIRRVCVEEKCDEILIAALTAFPGSATVQSHCLRALAAFVFGNDVVSFLKRQA